jgi:betaine-aldehyde dehydrogenase
VAFSILSLALGVGLGEAIVQHPRVRRIAFTGSHTSGMRVQQLAATSAIKTVSLELGGKNPLIIFADADVAQAARAAFVGMNLTAPVMRIDIACAG